MQRRSDVFGLSATKLISVQLPEVLVIDVEYLPE